MTVREDVLRELSTGPKPYTHIVRKCARANLPDGHVDRVLDDMVRAREIVVREWVVERGKFQPVYESRRRSP
ncbi:MAG: hypothetical protein IKQ60_06360 [Candidatus Methanomethylophilaceae archaeon]|nr:hypothetical protein [Candidatus Methanomethylophilaceae archaeon]